MYNVFLFINIILKYLFFIDKGCFWGYFGGVVFDGLD